MRTVPFFGELYRRTTGPLLSPPVTAEEARFIAATLELRSGDEVLDLGCGEGRHLEALRGSGARAFGLDFDAGSLREASRWAAPIQGDLRALPLRSNRLPAIYCWYSTLFVFDEEENRAALAEAARVLAPGGRLLIQSVNPDRLRESPQARFEKVLPDGARVVDEARFDVTRGVDEGRRTLEIPGVETLCASWSIRYYSLPELTRMLQQQGLRLERTFGGADGRPFTTDSLDLIALASKERHHGQ